MREQIAASLRLSASDTYGLLRELGRDSAGALQILEGEIGAESPSVKWLSRGELDALIRDLPSRPLGVSTRDRSRRLSLAGVQRKAVLVRDGDGRFGEPLGGMASTHILKPQFSTSEYTDIAVNEYFCMRLARRCGLGVADVELDRINDQPCLVVERFDRDVLADPVSRIHQEDLCQALGLTPDFKFQQPEWRVPSYEALADLLDEHSLQPGVDRLVVARGAIFNFLVANADAHAKNVALLHQPRGGVRMAPLYDIVCTGLYPDLSATLALAIGDEFDPERIGVTQWGDLGFVLGLNPRGFERERRRLAGLVSAEARQLAGEARVAGWHRPVVDEIVELAAGRAVQL